MSQTDTPRTSKRAKINPADVEEGDEVFLGINAHGTVDDLRGGVYESEIMQGGVHGTVVERPRETFNDALREGEAILADFTVETDDGERYTFHVDNRYVTGHHPGLGRRSDVGHFGGFYDPSEW